MILKTEVIKNTTFSAFSNNKILLQESNKNFSNEPFSTIIELSIDTLMGETKPIDSI